MTRLQVVLLLFSVILYAEADQSENHIAQFSPESLKAYGNYLFQNGDYRRALIEYERYLFFTGSQDDSILFSIGLCYQKMGNYEKAIHVFSLNANLGQDPILTEQSRLAQYHNMFLAEKWVDLSMLNPQNGVDFYFYYYGNQRLGKEINALEIASSIQDSVFCTNLLSLNEQRKRLSYKSPATAGILSLIVPGLGKAYYGRGKDGLYALVLTWGTAAASILSHAEKSYIFSSITGLMSVVFYSGTIYGSYLGAQKYNEQVREQWFRQVKALNPVLKNQN